MPHKVTADPQRNLLRIQYHGHVTGAEGADCLRAALALLPQMHDGFTVLTDISGLDLMDLDCAISLARAMDAFAAHGAGHIVRVIPDTHKDIGLNILAAVHYRHLRAITCQSAVEAERVLPRP